MIWTRGNGRKVLAFAALAALMVGSTAVAKDEQKKEAHRIGEAAAKSDAYLDQMALFDSKQVALGELALQRAQSEEVRQFAERLVQDHRQNRSDLMDWAYSKDIEVMTVTLATPMMGVGGSGGEKRYDKDMHRADMHMDKDVMKAQKDLDKLGEKDGKDFDKAFLSQVLDDQEKGKKMLGKGEKKFESDPVFTSMIAKTDALVMAHITEGKRIHHSMK
ncbi:DUF4142 domain-containing protein [Stigmatella aurantiaca]|uniref:Conserved uncharacterized protein n=1 Tax=Stigmatella aurantiaca (strain DW4/3-1) TaxID=378806 RepID=Q08Z34_STIAD|nr:DUF4142 domain-containing protein [Stigmatella aurantiaca]ADO74507.1 conserved uncharacterized protein [Stigmatella aurantiaca DW4/3-1]EAU65731.1 conserved hypothetical protein [Stigmatella aurantiaca DW4/3-1]